MLIIRLGGLMMKKKLLSSIFQTKEYAELGFIQVQKSKQLT